MKFLVILLGFVCTAALAAPNAPKVHSFRKIKDTEILPSEETRVTRGQRAARNQFPYQVSLQWAEDDFSIHFCGGSLISASVVLTAASCAADFVDNTRNISILAGALSLNESSSSSQRRLASSFIVHENWPVVSETSDSPFDIALIKVNPPFDLSSSVQPVVLPSQGADVSGSAVYSGWGYTSDSDYDYPSILQYADVDIISNDQCADVLVSLVGSSEPLDDSQICTDGEQNVAICTGDVGGPLVQNGVQVGVLSWGLSPCGVSIAPSVSTKVPSYVNWINANL
ncbi:trypsin-1-like [Agrilus planipennis]|nr:trypsin-1-like [Agrilus planipennis]XP_025836555.1 trypsin-1-like [Agrilus planipennis]XP_025836556.1 trypsin-1-like [Agrilus planipennis]